MIRFCAPTFSMNTLADLDAPTVARLTSTLEQIVNLRIARDAAAERETAARAKREACENSIAACAERINFILLPEHTPGNYRIPLSFGRAATVTEPAIGQPTVEISDPSRPPFRL